MIQSQRRDQQFPSFAPVQGQLNHFYRYAETKIPIAEKRYLSLPLHLPAPTQADCIEFVPHARARGRE